MSSGENLRPVHLASLAKDIILRLVARDKLFALSLAGPDGWLQLHTLRIALYSHGLLRLLPGSAARFYSRLCPPLRCVKRTQAEGWLASALPDRSAGCLDAVPIGRCASELELHLGGVAQPVQDGADRLQ